jgi:hypothetical protein
MLYLPQLRNMRVGKGIKIKSVDLHNDGIETDEICT